MIRKLLMAGIFSGIIAGALLTLVQQFQVIPLILEAETYEVQSNQHSHDSQVHEHSTENTSPAEWAPNNGNERTLFTLMTNILLGIGFSLLLVALMTATNHSGWQLGLLWGLAGFCVFYLAPSFDLPPELPGSIAAGLEHRQLWWLATVISTAIGLGLLFLNPALTFRLLGVLFIIAPHFFTSSITVEHISQVPKELINSFIVSTSFANILFWSTIGTFNGVFKSRFFESNPMQKIAS